MSALDARRRAEARALRLGLAASVLLHALLFRLPIGTETRPMPAAAPAPSAAAPGTRVVNLRAVEDVGTPAEAEREEVIRPAAVERSADPEAAPAGDGEPRRMTRAEWVGWLRETLRPARDPRLLGPEAERAAEEARAARVVLPDLRALRPRGDWDGGLWGRGAIPIEPVDPGGPFPSAPNRGGVGGSIPVPWGKPRILPPPLPVPPPPHGWVPPDSVRPDSVPPDTARSR